VAGERLGGQQAVVHRDLLVGDRPVLESRVEAGAGVGRVVELAPERGEVERTQAGRLRAGDLEPRLREQ
jgi:hypothetical protein